MQSAHYINRLQLVAVARNGDFEARGGSQPFQAQQPTLDRAHGKRARKLRIIERHRLRAPPAGSRPLTKIPSCRRRCSRRPGESPPRAQPISGLPEIGTFNVPKSAKADLGCARTHG